MAVASDTQLLVAIPDPKLLSATVEPVAVPMERAAWLAAVPSAPADNSDPHGWYQRWPRLTGLRVTLVLLTSGATLNPESTAGGASLHVLDDRVRVQAEGQRWQRSW
jgi:hypothetical protein